MRFLRADNKQFQKPFAARMAYAQRLNKHGASITLALNVAFNNTKDRLLAGQLLVECKNNFAKAMKAV